MARPSSLEPHEIKSRKSKGLSAWLLNVPEELSETGKRQQLFFPTKKAAYSKCEELQTRKNNFGTSLKLLSSSRITQAAKAYELLDKHGIELLDAVNSYIKQHKQRTESIPFLKLFDLFLAAKTDRNLKYQNELRIARDRFATLHARLASDITHRDLEPLLSVISPGARNPLMRYLRAVFYFGIKRGYLQENPISRLDFAEIKRKEVEVIPVDQIERMLVHALEHDLELLPFLVIGFFAGCRPDGEIEKLEWPDFDPVDGVLTVRAEISKTARRRFIKLSENALSWLDAYRSRGGVFTGKIVPYATTRRLRAHRALNRVAAGVIRWPNSAMRHCFASYHLAKFEDIGRLTLMTGHSSPTMLWNHYYKAVPKAEAEKFWSINPPAGLANVVAFRKGA
jgi:integrase/recombinase XerD